MEICKHCEKTKDECECEKFEHKEEIKTENVDEIIKLIEKKFEDFKQTFETKENEPKTPDEFKLYHQQKEQEMQELKEMVTELKEKFEGAVDKLNKNGFLKSMFDFLF